MKLNSLAFRGRLDAMIKIVRPAGRNRTGGGLLFIDAVKLEKQFLCKYVWNSYNWLSGVAATRLLGNCGDRKGDLVGELDRD